MRRRLIYTIGFALGMCGIMAAATRSVAPSSQDPPASTAGTKSGNSPAKSSRGQDSGTTRAGHARLRPFYDFSFHAASSNPATKPADYLIDQRFWSRRPTLVVVTPVTANVLQPDEGYAETTTENLIRQIAADLGVREAHDQVSQTIDIIKSLRKKAKGNGDSEPDRSKTEPTAKNEPIEQTGTAKSAEPKSQPAPSDPAKPEARGLQKVQLILLADTRPLYSGMSLYDRQAVVERSLKEYLKKVPVKRERVLGYLGADQFHFGAFPGKESATDMMATLGITRPDFHVMVVDRNGEVVGSWNKATLDPKQVSATYIRASKE